MKGEFCCFLAVLGRIRHRYAQFGVVQPVLRQLLPGRVIGHIVGQRQAGDAAEVALHARGVERQHGVVLRGEIHVLAAIGVGAVLGICLIGDLVAVRAVKADAVHLAEVRGFVVIDHIAQRGVEIVQRVGHRQIDLAVPERYIPLGIHSAVIAQTDLIIRIRGGQIDRADRVVQPVLALIGHILDDKRRAEGRKHIEQLVYLVLAYREGRVPVIDPAVLFVKGERLGLVFPGKRLDRIRIHFEHDLAARADLLLFLLVLHDDQRCHADHRQHAEQGIKPFSPLHSAFSSFSK